MKEEKFNKLTKEEKYKKYKNLVGSAILFGLYAFLFLCIVGVLFYNSYESNLQQDHTLEFYSSKICELQGDTYQYHEYNSKGNIVKCVEKEIFIPIPKLEG